MTEAVVNVSLPEWSVLRPEAGGVLADRALATAGDRELAKGLGRARVLEVTELRAGLSVRSFAHVGRVRVGDVEVTVRPKLAWPSLLNLLRYAYGFRRLRLLPETAQRLDGSGFADLLVCQLTAEAGELVARGLHRAYTPTREWLASPRGRIDVGRLAGRGGVLADRLPCTHHPRVEDNPLNRVLRGGLTLAAGAASDLRLRREANRLAAILGEGVPASPLTPAAIGRAFVALNRLTSAYEPALTLVRLLAEAQGVVLGDAGPAARLPGFAFDMNRFFQALVSRLLRDNLPDHTVCDEHHLRGMVEYLPGGNPKRRRPPVPRPDFVLLKGTATAAVLDAKYRDLWAAKLPRGMLYQLALYAAASEGRTAAILYPTPAADAREQRIRVNDPLGGAARAEVVLRPVVLARLEELIEAGDTAIATRERRQYARWLGTGSGTTR